VYGQEIHEMSEMAAVDFGQYAHSNQPVHHVLYILAMAGRPDRTQYWVRRVMNTLYTQDKFPGDEDTGSMSAWFMFSSMGFYPLCPGRPEYIVGSPLFERVRIHLSEGRTTVIEAHNQKEDAPYVSRLLVNGNRHTSASISHDVIMSGGRLSFLMQTTPGRGVPGNG
jgi:putative alpha-1,2-mannosidase